MKTSKTAMMVATVFAAITINSCDRESIATVETTSAEIKVRIHGASGTKASDVSVHKGEDYVNNASVYVFDADPTSAGYKLLEAYKETSAEDISNDKTSATVTLSATTGQKHIYVIANQGVNMASGGAALAETITTEDEMLSAISDFSDNSSGNFVMAGGMDPGKTILVAGSDETNNMDIQLKRIVARIKVGSIIGDFTSPALRQCRFLVKRIYLLNVPKQVKYVNGDCADVFGSDDTALYDGMPDGFSGASGLPYYVYAAPSASSGADGFYNWSDPSAWKNGDTMTLDELDQVAALTSVAFSESDGKIYQEPNASIPANSGNKVSVEHDFYCYPNSSTPAVISDGDMDVEVDYTTKLVVETEITISGKDCTYYYPISIPYVQPNYAYTIGSITLKRLGSTDPFHTVTTAECNFNLSVREWDEGEITGDNNGKTGEDGNFEI